MCAAEVRCQGTGPPLQRQRRGGRDDDASVLVRASRDLQQHRFDRQPGQPFGVVDEDDEVRVPSPCLDQALEVRGWVPPRANAPSVSSVRRWRSSSARQRSGPRVAGPRPTTATGCPFARKPRASVTRALVRPDPAGPSTRIRRSPVAGEKPTGSRSPSRTPTTITPSRWRATGRVRDVGSRRTRAGARAAQWARHPGREVREDRPRIGPEPADLDLAMGSRVQCAPGRLMARDGAGRDPGEGQLDRVAQSEHEALTEKPGELTRQHRAAAGDDHSQSRTARGLEQGPQVRGQGPVRVRGEAFPPVDEQDRACRHSSGPNPDPDPDPILRPSLRAASRSSTRRMWSASSTSATAAT